MKIHPVNRTKRGNSYCGPAALSILTGFDTDHCARVIRNETGVRAVKATTASAMHCSIRAIGLGMHQFDAYTHRAKPTLAAWLRENKHHRTAGRVFLVLAGRHWQVISGRRYACSLTSEIVSVRDPRVKRRARVLEVYEIDRCDRSRGAL